jgi:hypothetical protein
MIGESIAFSGFRLANTTFILAAPGQCSMPIGGSNYPNVSYYPGTQDPRSAGIVMVNEGSAISGIDIGMQPSPGVTISGRHREYDSRWQSRTTRTD